ncbi:MAG: hypothetical protein HY684_02665 [Chloroflexi bacterium]|nr:hypothetical protein [Chloroflexota bacterium]
MNLTVKRWKVSPSLDAFFDFAYEQGWTDGLPVVPPTEDRVRQMLQGVKRDPGDLVAVLAPRNGKATVGKIAINAVMAGCKPDYMPILLTAVEALARPEVNLLGIQTTTNAVAPLTIVHGPITQQVGMNCGTNVLGSGNRANATIGRAIRLIMINVGGGIPGVGDKATLGQPGKYVFCIAEHWEENPWTSLHVDKGFDASGSAVTIFPASGTENLATGGITDPKSLLLHIANTMTRWGSNLIKGAPAAVLIIFPLGHARLSFAAAGWTKQDIREFLFEHARIDPQTVPTDILEARDRHGGNPGYIDGKICPVRSTADINIVVAGGHEPHHIQVLPGASHWGTVTQLIPEATRGQP